MPAGNPEAYGALAAMAAPSSTSPAPLSPEAMGPEEEMMATEDEDKLMLVDDFRNAPPEDALAAFEALLSAFNVKRS